MSDAVADRLSGGLLDLADQVRRLAPPGRTDPARFWEDKTELATRLAELADEAAARFGSDNWRSHG